MLGPHNNFSEKNLERSNYCTPRHLCMLHIVCKYRIEDSSIPLSARLLSFFAFSCSKFYQSVQFCIICATELILKTFLTSKHFPLYSNFHSTWCHQIKIIHCCLNNYEQLIQHLMIKSPFWSILFWMAGKA